MPYVLPRLISERENTLSTYPDGSIDPAGAEDCVPCSVLMGLNALKPGAFGPTTLNEAERLRHDSGYPATGPTALGADPPHLGIIAGAQKRYTVGPIRIVDNFRDLWDALTPGHGAAVIGRPANLPDGNPIRQYLPKFLLYHCVYVQRRTNALRVVWFDPMAPQAGPWFYVPQGDLAKFYGDGNEAAIFGIAKT